MNSKLSTPYASDVSHTATQVADHLADKADQAIGATRRQTTHALDNLESGVEHLRTQAPSAFSRAAAQMEELTRRGVERARDAGNQVRDQAHRASDRAVGYVRDEPVKSVLIAVAAGAAVAMLAGWFARSRSNH